MKRKPNNFSPPCAAGFTLIEVTAAIAVLGVILVGVLLTKASHTRQLAHAAEQRAAIREADQLLSDWQQHEDTVPIGRSGVTEAALGHRFAWRTRRLHDRTLEQFDCTVVRLELRTEDSATADPLLEVDLVVAEPEEGNR